MSENPGPASPGAPHPDDDQLGTSADTGPGPDPTDVDGPGTTHPDEPDEG